MSSDIYENTPLPLESFGDTVATPPPLPLPPKCRVLFDWSLSINKLAFVNVPRLFQRIQKTKLFFKEISFISQLSSPLNNDLNHNKRRIEQTNKSGKEIKISFSKKDASLFFSR
jgi:hypothetical protein